LHFTGAVIVTAIAVICCVLLVTA